MRKRRRSRAPSWPLTSPDRSRLLGGGSGKPSLPKHHRMYSRLINKGSSCREGRKMRSHDHVSVSRMQPDLRQRLRLRCSPSGWFSCRQRHCVTGRRARPSSPQERLLIHRDARWFSSWQTAQRVRKGGRGDGLMLMRAHHTISGRTHDDIHERQRESQDRSPFVSAS